jgi:aminopeptidase
MNTTAELAPARAVSAPLAPLAGFPPFDLARLLRTVFAPHDHERVCILIDLDDPHAMKDYAFLANPDLSIQRIAYDTFYHGLKHGVLADLDLRGGEMFAFEKTGGSNLDLPDLAVDAEGRELSLERDIYPNYDLILCISTYSATAPLTAFAKQYGFRGATLHGVNPIILASGLAVDYDEVSRQAEKLRLGLTRADSVAIDFGYGGKVYTLDLALGGQEAQKSHGLCRGGPDIANLPAGEVYFVPTGAEGQFPMQYEDGTVGLMTVHGGRVVDATLLSGEERTVSAHRDKLLSDPVTGELGELGFGTQVLPVSGRDIQDEKVFGTFHVATGRSDHLGGSLTPDRFANRLNATHDDILFSPEKTPDISAVSVRMRRGDGETVTLIENFQPAPYLRDLVGR